MYSRTHNTCIFKNFCLNCVKCAMFIRTYMCGYHDIYKNKINTSLSLVIYRYIYVIFRFQYSYFNTDKVYTICKIVKHCP
jgi:hypothetical protein